MNSRIIHKKKVKHHKIIRLPPFKPELRTSKLLELDHGGTTLRKYVSEKRTMGVVGVAVVASSSRSLRRWLPLNVEEIAEYIKFPTGISSSRRDLLLLESNGKCKPLNLPDLSDSSLSPRPVKDYLKWLVDNMSNENVVTTLDYLTSINRVQVPHVLEVFNMGSGEHEMRMPSNANSMKAIKLNCADCDTVDLQLRTNNVSEDPTEGRQTMVKFTAHHENRGEFKSLFYGPSQRSHEMGEEDWSILVWNCRGLGKTSFPTIFQAIMSKFSPDIVILFEIRVSEFMCNRILKGNKFCKSVIVGEGVGVGGGVSIIAAGGGHVIVDLERRGNYFEGRLSKV